MSTNIHPIFDKLVQQQERERFLNQKSNVFWLTGLSGSGKSTIAKGVERSLFLKGYFAKVIDGDNVRTGLSSNLSFSLSDREENIRRVSELAKLFVESGIITICTFISPTIQIRNLAREIIGEETFKEIYIKASLEICEGRDVKGLYKKARSGEISGFTGIDSPYEPPVNPDFEVVTSSQGIDESVRDVHHFIIKESSINGL